MSRVDAIQSVTLSRHRTAIAVLLAGAMFGAPSAMAQEESEPRPASRSSEAVKLDDSADAAVEAYLEAHNLRSVLAVQLRERFDRSNAETKNEIVEKLGRIYVQLLSETTNPEERRLIEDRSRELLRLAPDAESFELRINLAKATYLKAEQLAESDRLRLATQEDRQEAERILRSVLPMFREIGLKVAQRISTLERREQVANDSETRGLREKLADARRVRSLAMYYAGWSGYYLALMTDDVKTANQAMEDFGWLLNAGSGNKANLEKLQRPLLKYEHIARAAMGAAMCAAAAGDDVSAVRWLDAVSEAPDLPVAVRNQLFTRRIAVLGKSERFADLEREVRGVRVAMEDGSVKPLEVNDARLLAIVSLEGKQKIERREKDKSAHVLEQIEALTAVAFSDLIARGEAGHVLDLVRRYGSAPIGDEGFIVYYVRGLQSFDRAREAHRASGTPEDDPATDPKVANIYRESAKTLQAAVASRDAGTFKADYARAWLKLGLCWFYAGDFEKSAEVFEQATKAGLSDEQRREALWYTIVALDKAVEAGLPRSADRDRFSAQYLDEFPTSDQAAQLLLRSSGRKLVAKEEGIKRLLAVEPNSPLYASARRQASNMLFDLYRGARGPARTAAAARFVEIAIRVFDTDAQLALGDETPAARQAASTAVQRARQLADALLALEPPDVKRAESVLTTLDDISARRSLDISALAEELAYRRMQMALASNNQPEADRQAGVLRKGAGPFAQAAEVLLYERARDQLTREPENVGLAREVVRAGARVLSRIRETNRAAADNMRNAIAEAATKVYQLERDASMLELALKMDRELVDGGINAAPILRRLALNLESTGQDQNAFDTWISLLNTLDPTTPDWLEVRYLSLVAQSRFDAMSASRTLRDYKLLHPDFGPEPWGDKLRELEARLPAPTATPAGGGR